MSPTVVETIALRAVAPHFQRSINLTYDAHNADYVAGYIPTPNGAKTLANILENTNPGRTQRAHVIHAAYGSGKSLLGLVLRAFADPDETNNVALNSVVDRLDRVFPVEAEKINAFQAGQRRLLPVLLSGNEGPLSLALTRALTQTLSQIGLGDLKPRTQFQAALSTIDLWERTYPAVFRQLEELLLREKSSMAELRDGLAVLQPEALSFFETIYPELTAGARFDIYSGQSLTEAFHYTAAALADNGFDGIMVVWDEFGRFIESKVGEAFGPEASLLQSFAEFCNRSGEQQVHLVLITHRVLSGYAAQLPITYQQEWARIAERFWSHDVISDFLVTNRLIAEALVIPDADAWQHFTEQHRAAFDNLTAQSLDLALFPDLDDVSLRQQIIEKAWPLHPLTIYALPRLSSRVAQNERTLFTFLAAEDAHTLTEHLSQPPTGWWTLGLDVLWDYFAEAIRADTGPDGSHVIWSGVMNALSKIPLADPLAAKIVKAMGVLLLVGDVNVQLSANAGRIVPTTELLAWNLNLTEKEITGRLEALAQRRAVVYRRADGFWSFTRGSDIDLEAEIGAAIERRNPTPLQMRRLLEQEITLPFLTPRGYNLERGMTRFFWGLYRWPGELKGLTVEAFLKQLGANGYADGAVVYVLVKNQAEREEALAILSTLPTGRIVFVIPEQPLLMAEPLRELFALRDLSNDAVFMEQDERLEREIAFFVEDTQRRLSNALRPLLDLGSGRAIWYWPDGQRWQHERPRTDTEVSRLLSRLCDQWFNQTPRLNNELLNQQDPSTQQIRAAEKVIDALLSHPNEIFPPNLGLIGYGPDYLIFRTILVVPGLLHPVENDKEADDTAWRLVQPSHNEVLARIWDIGQAFLQRAVNEEQEAAELVDVLLSPPYGLRRGVLPVLLSAMFYPRLHVLTVRKNRRAISPLTGNVLTELCCNPESFTIEVGQWDVQRKALWDVLQEQFGGSGLLTEPDHQPLSYLSLTLLRWLQSLPRFCRDTQQISTEALQFRNLIRKAQRDPAQVLLHDLLDLLAGDTPYTDYEHYCQLLATRLSQITGEIASAYQGLLHQLDNFAETEFAPDAAVPQRHGQAALRYWLAKLEQQSSEPLATYRFSDTLVQRFIEAVKQENEASRFWDQLSYAVVGIYPYDWNDRSIETFKQNLLEAKDRLERELFELAEDEAVIELNVNLPGDEEHTYRFRPSDLSSHGQRILQNFVSTLEIAGRPLSPDERRQVVLALLHHVMEGSKPDAKRRTKRQRRG